MKPGEYLTQEPPAGSVIAIDWGRSTQEIWVHSQPNTGNWYTTDVPLGSHQHPTWHDVKRRAADRTVTLLAGSPADVFAVGYDAGVCATAAAVTAAVDNARYSLPAPGGEASWSAADLVRWMHDQVADLQGKSAKSATSQTALLAADLQAVLAHIATMKPEIPNG